jgi:hypothetical protein
MVLQLDFGNSGTQYKVRSCGCWKKDASTTWHSKLRVCHASSTVAEVSHAVLDACSYSAFTRIRNSCATSSLDCEWVKPRIRGYTVSLRSSGAIPLSAIQSSNLSRAVWRKTTAKKTLAIQFAREIENGGGNASLKFARAQRKLRRSLK